MARKGIPVLDFDDLIIAIQALSAPSGTDVAIDATGMEIITATNAQGALKQLDTAVDSVNASLTHKVEVASLSTQLTIDYADSTTIGYRTTESTKVDITQLTGYPTGKTIVATIAKCADYRGAEVFVDGGNYLRGVMKVSATVGVTIYVFYK